MFGKERYESRRAKLNSRFVADKTLGINLSEVAYVNAHEASNGYRGLFLVLNSGRDIHLMLPNWSDEKLAGFVQRWRETKG